MLVGITSFVILLVITAYLNDLLVDPEIKNHSPRMLPIGFQSEEEDPAQGVEPDRLTKSLRELGNKLGKFLSNRDGTPNGYAKTIEGHGYLDPGHWQSTIFVGVLVLVYFILYFRTEPSLVAVDERYLPTTFYAVLLLTFLAAIFGFLAFWLDRYRVPVSLFAVISWFLLFSGKDHYFRIRGSILLYQRPRLKFRRS